VTLGGVGLMKLLRLVLLLAFFVLFLPAASAGGNHAVFSDPVGDNQSLASDITAVDITSQDDGGFTVKVTMNDPQGHFFTGDELDVGFDTDSNPTNGYNGTGYDTYLEAFGHTNAQTTFQFCNYTDRLDCTGYAGTEATDVSTGPSTHVVTFNNTQGGWRVVRFYAAEIYVSPASGTRYFDSTQVFTYDMNADPDHDGITGSDDQCPTIKGKSSKKPGCPSKLPLPHYAYNWADSSAPTVVFRDFRVTAAPPGTTVTVRRPGAVYHRRGSGPIRGLAGRSLRVGTKLTITFSSKNNYGRFIVLRVGAGSVPTIGDGCTQIASTKPLSTCP